ncbi:MAG: [4Fe-4S] proteins maturation [Claussenomyces sp. TS43310]|nr:MAG: [4Fe-4S] proteins maturation [Claussenomyces sp. TS43310]
MSACTVPGACLHLSPSAPAARAFLQLARRRAFHTQPVLDFLAPTVAQHPLAHGRRWRGMRSAAASMMLSRAFGVTAPGRATAAIWNPKKDDDGNNMVVEITPRASSRLKEIMAKDQNPNLALKITVESGGCHGFQYLMSLTTLPPLDPTNAVREDAAIVEDSATAFNTSSVDLDAMPTPGSPRSSEPEMLHSTPNTPASFNTTPRQATVDEDDTVFAAMDGSGAKVIMDGPSLELLKGSKIDYTTELIGSQFKIVDNPLATSSCGCGTSFDIKA